ARMTTVSRRWVLASDVQHIAPLVDEVVCLCQAAGFSSRQCRLNVPIAITEAVTNAMVRGNGGAHEKQVVVVVRVSMEQLVVEVVDEGSGFELDGVEQSPEDVDWLEREDGRGVFLMRQLMDRVENRCLDHAAGHLLRLILNKA
ncbi:ATP-binding protein, partial [Gemmatimonas sp.]|uniref:ATP-binding protein n=2 Tax=Gemmatimonas sp. TaxID=1962908 RepID=UPI00391A0C2C